MTKKHYIKIAAIFKEKLQMYPNEPIRTACLQDVANALSNILRDDNPNFDRQRFMTACGF